MTSERPHATAEALGRIHKPSAGPPAGQDQDSSRSVLPLSPSCWPFRSLCNICLCYTYLPSCARAPWPRAPEAETACTGAETRAVDSFGLPWPALIRPRRLTRLARLARLWTLVRERIAAIEPFHLSTRESIGARLSALSRRSSSCCCCPCPARIESLFLHCGTDLIALLHLPRLRRRRIVGHRHPLEPAPFHSSWIQYQHAQSCSHPIRTCHILNWYVLQSLPILFPFFPHPSLTHQPCAIMSTCAPHSGSTTLHCTAPASQPSNLPLLRPRPPLPRRVNPAGSFVVIPFSPSFGDRQAIPFAYLPHSLEQRPPDPALPRRPHQSLSYIFPL